MEEGVIEEASILMAGKDTEILPSSGEGESTSPRASSLRKECERIEVMSS